jgi:hypothetical protein
MAFFHVLVRGNGHKVMLKLGVIQAGKTYGIFHAAVEIEAGRTTKLDYTIWMPIRLALALGIPMRTRTSAYTYVRGNPTNLVIPSDSRPARSHLPCRGRCFGANGDDLSFSPNLPTRAPAWAMGVDCGAQGVRGFTGAQAPAGTIGPGLEAMRTQVPS